VCVPGWVGVSTHGCCHNSEAIEGDDRH